MGRTPSTSKNVADTVCPATCSGVPSTPRMVREPPANVAMDAKLRLCWLHSRNSSGEAMDVKPLARRSHNMTRRSVGSLNGKGRRKVASASANIALLAPMPSASVSAATQREARRCLHLPERVRHIVPELFEPLCQPHFSFSLSAQVFARAFELSEIADARQHDLARGLRVHAALDQFARAHLDVELELFVHFLVERHAPQPRTQ